MMMLTKSLKRDLSSHHDPAIAIEGVLPREDFPFFLNPRHSFSTWNQSLRMILIFVKDTKIILIVEKGTKIILIVEKQTSLQEFLSSLNVPLPSLQSRIGKFYPLDLRKWKWKVQIKVPSWESESGKAQIKTILSLDFYALKSEPLSTWPFAKVYIIIAFQQGLYTYFSYSSEINRIFKNFKSRLNMLRS